MKTMIAALLALAAGCSDPEPAAPEKPSLKETWMPLVGTLHTKGKSYTLSARSTEAVVLLYNDLDSRGSNESFRISESKIEPVHQFLLFKGAPAPAAVPDFFLYYYDPEGVVRLSSGKYFRVDDELRARLEEALKLR